MLSLVAAFSLAVDIPLVTFDGAPATTHKFVELNDPVMGGRSTGTWTVSGGLGIFDGQVVDVPSLKAPGFIKAAADGKFADVSPAAMGSLVLRVRSTTPAYRGFRVSFASGSLSAGYACAGGGSIPLSRGCYKAKFSVPSGNFTDVSIPFANFSDVWSPATGEQTKKCSEDARVCPSASKLAAITRIEVWAEGALGKAHLEVLSISASAPALRAESHTSTRATQVNSQVVREAVSELEAMAEAEAGKMHVASSGDCPTVTTQPDFNLTEYVAGGSWYVQQSMAVTYLPATDNYCVRTDYAFIDSTHAHVHNYANAHGVNGHVVDSNANLKILGGICAEVVNTTDPAKLSVGPCKLPDWVPGARGPYWVVAAGPSAEKYEWALVSGGQPTHKAAGGCRTGTGVNGSGLWIFTRAPARDDEVVKQVRAVAHAKGFDVSVLQDVVQTGCLYKPA